MGISPDCCTVRLGEKLIVFRCGTVRHRVAAPLGRVGMGERTRLRLVFLPSVSGEGGGEQVTASPQERHLTAGWREELSGSLEPATPTTPKETAAPWNGAGRRRPRLYRKCWDLNGLHRYTYDNSI